MLVMSQGNVKNHRKLVANIEKWKARVDAFICDHGKKLSDKCGSLLSSRCFEGTLGMSCVRVLILGRRTEESERMSTTSCPTESRLMTRGRARWTRR